MPNRFGTLRSKLVALNLAIFGVILSAVCLLVLAVSENYLRRDFDEWLTSLGASIASEIIIPGNEILPEPMPTNPGLPANPFAFPGLYLQLRLSDGTVLERSTTLKNIVLPLSDQAAATRESHATVMETLTNGATDTLLGPGQFLRMLTLYHDEPGGSPYYLQVGVSAARLNNALARLHRLIVMLMIVGMVGIGFASWLMARRSLTPIGRIARDLQRLSAAHLDRRITVPTEGDELSEMVITANRTLDRLETAFRAQQQFLANAAHELKTPVTVVMGEADILGRHDRTREEYIRFAASAQDEMRHFAQLIDGLLTLARSHAGFPIPTPEPISVNEAVADAARTSQPLADRREVRLILKLAPPDPGAPDAVVLGDSELLQIMVGNLIRNAIRYSPVGQAVEIEVRARQAEVSIRVSDHGPGIPAHLLDRVFEPFFRGPHEPDGVEGMGLGLAIARGVAELHRGSVTAANCPGSGCELLVRLPRAAPE